jgi:Nidogen-like/PEP-CTERM motif
LKSKVSLMVGVAILALSTQSVRAAAVVSFVLSNQGTLAANDDGSAGPVNLGLSGALNFFGATSSTVFVNNNGNITFTSALPQFTPNGLATGVGQPIIAAFFADVDTRGAGSGLTTYGNATYNGHTAFVINWPNVGYFPSATNKLNNFQMILTDRSDTGAGNFDIEFNYNQIQWETGGASGGTNGLGGVSAAVGYSNGLSGTNNVFFQLPGSLVNGALLDGGVNALITNSLNSSVAGRYDFSVRNGQVINPSPEPSTFALLGLGVFGAAFARRRLANK